MAAAKSFDNQNSLISQAEAWEVLTPHDATNFVNVPKAIAISSSTGGVFIAVDEDGNTAPFYGNPGQIIPIRPVRINATGLTPGLTFTGLKS
jgi:hypothetical protein